MLYLISAIKPVVLCVATIMLATHLCAQPQKNDTSALFKQTVVIDNNATLPQADKIKLLHALKKKAEQQRQTLDSGYINALVKLAAYEYDDRLDSSIAYSLAALQINRQLPRPLSPDKITQACYNLAVYYNLSLQQSKALAFYDTVIYYCKQYGDSDNYLITSRYRKSAIYSALGDYQKMVEESKLGIYESVQAKDSSYYLILLNLCAIAQMRQNQLPDAIANVEKAIPVALQSSDTYWLATAYETKALILEKQKDYVAAERYFLKAIHTRPHHTDYYQTVAVDYNNLGNFYLFRTNNLKKAKENFTKTIEFGNKCSGMTKSLMLLMAYENLAEAYRKEHRFQEAVYYYTSACNQMNLRTSDFLFSNPTANQYSVVEYKDLVFSLLFGKIDFLQQLYRETRQRKYLTASLATARLTDTLMTRTRHENLSEASKLYWRNNSREFFNNVLEACYLLRDTESAFYFMEKSQAVLLNDKWNELKASDHLPPAEREKEEAYQTQIVKQQQALSSLSPGTAAYRQAETKLLQTIYDLEHFFKSLEKKYPDYYQQKYADDVLSLPQFQAHLAQKKQSFIRYFMSDSAIYALGIAPQNTTFIKIKPEQISSSQLSAFLSLCSHKQALNSKFTRFASLSHTLYRELFEPLHLPKGNVVICTDNFFIPFDALCRDKAGTQFLVYDYNLSYVYSARSLLMPYKGSTAAGNFVGFAPVSFSRPLHVVDLLESGTALQQAAGFYSRNKVITGQEATRSNFFSHATRYSVLTVFSHALADTTGREPELYMRDSVIKLSELQLLTQPSVQLVLLSACQTNIGKNATGEGIYSLARGFASAGIPAVSATLWKADEQTIYLISARFNEYLSAGMDKSEALQKAKIWFLQNNSGEHSLPFYWANMVLIGNTDPVALSNPVSGWLWLAAAACLLLCFFLYRKLKRGGNKTGMQRHFFTRKEEDHFIIH